MEETTKPGTQVLKAILFCAAFTGLFIILAFPKFLFPTEHERLAHGIIGTIAALITTYAFLRFDKRTFESIGLKFEKSTIQKFLLGVLIGIALMGILAASVILFSGFKVEINNNSNILRFLLGTAFFIPLALLEEIGFRAYPLVILKESSGTRPAIIITSILFAVYHIVNGWTIQDAFLGAGVWGIIYGLAAVWSNGIALATGIHYAANITTEALGISGDAHNLFVIKQYDGSALEHYQSSASATLIPQLSLLIFGVICMEWYVRRVEAKNAKLKTPNSKL